MMSARFKQISSKQLYVMIVLLSLTVFSSLQANGQCVVPAGLYTNSITATSAVFNWSTTTADSFLVRYYESGSATYLYKTVKPGTSTNTIISGLLPNTTYLWQVRVWCSNGTSGAYQTTPLTFTTLAQNVSCVTPNQTTSTNVTSNGATVTWNAYITADSFMVRYAVRNTTNYVWIKVPGSQRTVSITGLLPNTTYDWAVRCICATSPTQSYSVLKSFTTLSSNCGVADPLYFSTTNKTATTATVGWRSVTGAVSYNVRYAVRYSGNWNTVTSTTNSKGLTNLVPLTWYEFQVQTVCASGASNWSTSGIFQTLSSALMVTRGPYLQLSTPSSIYIRWRTNNATDSRVRFGNSVTNLNLSVTQSGSRTEHSVLISGLAANTKYFYSVGTSTTTLGGDTGYYFITNPVVGSVTPVRIWAIGDFGVNSSGQRQVRDAYRNFTGNTHTNVWLWVGDNAYADGTDAEYQSNVFNVYPFQFRKWVCWPATGNHDLHTAVASTQTGPFFDNFTLPKNAEAGGVVSGTEAYYSFNYANIHFVCLESTDAPFRAVNGAQAQWLAMDLSRNFQRWTIVYFHHPPYSKGSHNSDTETQLIEMRTNIVPILENYKVDLVLAGHSHSYERSYFIRGHSGLESTFNAATMAVNSGSGIFPNSYTKSAPNFFGTVYSVVGVSGQLGSTSSGWPHNAMYSSSNTIFGSMVIDVNGDRMDCKFLNSSGGISDQFTIQKVGSNFPSPSPSSSSSLLYPASPVFDLAMFPNPMHSDATVRFHLDKESSVRFEVFDINGRLVDGSVQDLNFPQGENQVRFPFTDASLPKGIYLMRMIAGDRSQTVRFVIE